MQQQCYHYRKANCCRVPTSLPSAKSRALGNKGIYQVLYKRHSDNVLTLGNYYVCRVLAYEHTVNFSFTVCLTRGTRQTSVLPSAGNLALGKESMFPPCDQTPCQRRADSVTELLFAECRDHGTRQSRVLPSVVSMALGKVFFCRVSVSWHSAN